MELHHQGLRGGRDMKDAASRSENLDDVLSEDLGEENDEHSITPYFILALLLKGKVLGILQACMRRLGRQEAPRPQVQAEGHEDPRSLGQASRLR